MKEDKRVRNGKIINGIFNDSFSSSLYNSLCEDFEETNFYFAPPCSECNDTNAPECKLTVKKCNQILTVPDSLDRDVI
jgi:hypothetical protein